MTRKKLYVSAAVVAAALTLSACGDNGEDTTAAPTTSPETTTSATDTVTTTEDAAHSDADVTFAQMMIPHHQQAIEMSDIILAKDDIPADVTSLAEQIKEAQGPEIAQLTDWLEQWGEPAEPQTGHDGHDMSTMEGMLSDAEIQQLSEAEGTDAARMFLEQMIAHHEGAIVMAEDEVAHGTYPPAVDLAQSIIDTQQQEIDDMQNMLSAL